MAVATGVAEKETRVPAMRLCDVLSLYVDPKHRGYGWENALSKLWGTWGICVSCNVTIAPAAEVLWEGERGGFVHAGHIRNGGALPWGQVFLPGQSRSVAERLKAKEEEREQMRAQAVA